jgi:hypothetical protein
MPMRSPSTTRRFQVVLIKPSHYDDDGYVIQWMRSIIPSNTLAVLYSLFQDSATRQTLGSDIAIDISVVDEITTRVRLNQIVKRFRRHGNFGLVIFAGVQTTSIRALSIWRARSGMLAFRWPLGASMCLAASQCCLEFNQSCKKRSTWEFRCLLVNLRTVATIFCAQQQMDR